MTSKKTDDKAVPVTIPDADGEATKQEHGAQVRLTGVARAAARGAAHPTLAGNTAVKAAVQGGIVTGDATDEQRADLEPADGSKMEKRIRERGEAEPRTPAGEDDEATGGKVKK